jgi:hypothetical protein
MERIWGPVNGFYFAAYAAPVGDGERHASYVKVCWSKPDSYWDADCAFKLFGGEDHATSEAAIGAAARLARNETARLPPQARTIAERRRREHIEIPNLLVAGFFRHRLA